MFNFVFASASGEAAWGKLGKGTKVVHYWRATPLEAKRRKPDKEVDKVAWLTAPNALARMTYADERAVLAKALTLEGTTPFLIVRKVHT